MFNHNVKRNSQGFSPCFFFVVTHLSPCFFFAVLSPSVVAHLSSCFFFLPSVVAVLSPCIVAHLSPWVFFCQVLLPFCLHALLPICLHGFLPFCLHACMCVCVAFVLCVLCMCVFMYVFIRHHITITIRYHHHRDRDHHHRQVLNLPFKVQSADAQVLSESGAHSLRLNGCVGCNRHVYLPTCPLKRCPRCAHPRFNAARQPNEV